MEIETIRECVGNAMDDFFYGKGYIAGSVSREIDTREDAQGNSEMTKLREAITENLVSIIDSETEKDWHLIKTVIGYTFFDWENYN